MLTAPESLTTETTPGVSNITGKKEYAYTTGAVGTLEKENTYTYGDSSWGDLLTGYNGQKHITFVIGVNTTY